MGWGEGGWRADWFGHWINWLGRAAGKEKLADVVEVAIIWECRANEAMLWSHGRNMGCKGNDTMWKKARAGGKGR